MSARADWGRDQRRTLSARPRPRFSFLLLIIVLVVTAITVGLAYRGWSFYRLSLEDRVEHPEFRTLRPSGLLGNGYGWIAAMLIVLNLSYLILSLIHISEPHETD